VERTLARASASKRCGVNVFLYDGGIVPDPEGIVTAGHDNKTARTVACREVVARHPPRRTWPGAGVASLEPSGTT
jgi:hypothetical protein